VTVSYATHDGSAVAGTDYTATSGKLTFSSGQTVKNITVPILDRTGAAPTRSFTVTLTKAANATIANGTGVVTIGASGAAAVASPGISAPPDMIAGEADGYLDVPVTLSAPGKSTVTVSYTTADSTAGGGTFCNATYTTASGTLTFTPGVTTKVIRIDLLDCHVAVFRSFTFNLSTPTNATIVRASARVGIVGDPTATGATPGLFVRDAVVDASAGTVSVPVMLGGPAGATSTSTVTVSYATHDGSAVADNDYTATSGKLTFAPGQTVKNITVPILRRTRAAPARSFTITLTKPANATIADNTGVVTIGASGATAVTSPKISTAPNAVVGEASGYLDVPVTLSAPGTSTVTVSYTTANGTASGGTFCNSTYVPVTGTLTFTPGVTTKVIRIDLLSCGVANPGTFTVNLSAPVNATITRPTTTITIVENPGKPGAPTHATAVAGHQSATVSFTAPNSDGGDPINSYTVTSTPGGIKASGSVSPITVTGLTSGVSYTFQVAATNSVGTGPKSKASNAVVPSAPVGLASPLRAHPVPVSVASLLRALSARG
jgi:chitinase